MAANRAERSSPRTVTLHTLRLDFTSGTTYGTLWHRHWRTSFTFRPEEPGTGSPRCASCDDERPLATLAGPITPRSSTGQVDGTIAFADGSGCAPRHSGEPTLTLRGPR